MNLNCKNQETGKIGEEIACEYLVKKRWIILKRNCRIRSDEIDIIARSIDGTLVFCEVKALVKMEGAGNDHLTPEDNLSGGKLRKITRACEFFSRRYPNIINEEMGWRMDLLAVDMGVDGKMIDIRHYENI